MHVLTNCSASKLGPHHVKSTTEDNDSCLQQRHVTNETCFREQYTHEDNYNLPSHVVQSESCKR